MALFVVCYDLIKTTDYSNLIDALENMDSVHTQESVWYVSRLGSARNLLDTLKPHIHEDDRLMVVEFRKRPVWTKAQTGTKKWVDDHF
jgi:CRISPR/Cas system-associated endoribonuclease Cas2